MKNATQTTLKPGPFKTLSISLSGAICGNMWMPASLGGILIRKNHVRGVWGFWQKGDTFRDALNSLLCREGGDFQNPLFSADTVLRIERRQIISPGVYKLHVWEREIGTLPACADLANPDAYAGDFCGECE